MPGRVSDSDTGTPRPGSSARNATEHRAGAQAVSPGRLAAMTRTKNYVAVYGRDPQSDAWLVHIKGIPGCATYGRTLRQAEARIPRRSRYGSIAIRRGWRSAGVATRARGGRYIGFRGPTQCRSFRGSGGHRDRQGCEKTRPHGPQPARHRRSPRHLPPARPATLGVIGVARGPPAIHDVLPRCGPIVLRWLAPRLMSRSHCIHALVGTLWIATAS